MLLVFDEAHKKHLQFLTTLDENVLSEFCRISLDFLINGTNAKIYQNASQKLGVDLELVQCGVEGLMHLFTESSKMNLSEIDFHDSILAAGFAPSQIEELKRHYLEKRQELRAILKNMAVSLPHYHDLEWRCDVQLASRSLHHQVTPLVTIKLTTEEQNKKRVTLLQTDPTNLVHLTNVLDQALQEVKSLHCQRIQRQIK